MPPLLALLVPLLAAAPLLAAISASTVWHRALVTQDQLTAASRSQTFQASEEIVCAIQATHTPWCHLFTHSAKDCVLYDLLVDSLADPPPDDQEAAACRTRHRNVCITDGKLLHHGDKVEVECVSYTCMDRVLDPTPNVSTCDAPFVTHDVGCVYLLQDRKSWCAARGYCSSLGADIAVVQADKFQSLQQFLADNANGQEVWVGVKGRKWLDGHDVDTSEWLHSQNEPNGDMSDCARMKRDGQTYFLADNECKNNYLALCMRK